jgi:hypothetical protein
MSAPATPGVLPIIGLRHVTRIACSLPWIISIIVNIVVAKQISWEALNLVGVRIVLRIGSNASF